MKSGAGCGEIEHVAAEEQPHVIQLHDFDGVHVRQISVAKADSLLPQHSHTHPHMTTVAKGSVRVWKDGAMTGDFSAPSGIYIEAGVKHTFLTLEDDVILYCIHNVSRTGEIEVAEEHQIVGETQCHSA